MKTRLYCGETIYGDDVRLDLLPVQEGRRPWHKTRDLRQERQPKGPDQLFRPVLWQDQLQEDVKKEHPWRGHLGSMKKFFPRNGEIVIQEISYLK